MIRKYLFGVALTALTVVSAVSAATGTVQGQDVKIEARSPLIVAKGEQFQIQFVVSTTKGDLDGSQFTPPTFSGEVNVLSGPVKAIGFYTSFDGRSQVSQVTNTYTYWVQATEEGKIDVSAARVTVGGEGYSTKPTVVEVSAAGGSAVGASARPQRQQQPQRQAATLKRDDILLRMEVSKREVYKGEPVVATLKLYRRVPLQLNTAKAPAMNGFWAQDLEGTDRIPDRETYGGKQYQTQVIRQWLLYPQRTGALEIDRMEISGIAHLETEAQPTGDPLLDMAYGRRSYKEVPFDAASAAVKIQVKDLPQPFPEGFSGAVGKFELDGVISGDRFPANTAGSVTIRLSGTGSFPLIEVPKIGFPAGFEPYSSKTNDRLAQTARGTTGERVYEYPFIARAEGRFTIPGITFAYFDPSDQRYYTLETGDFTVEVLRDESGGAGGGGLGMVSGVTKEDLKMLGQDIRFIRIGTPGLVRVDRGVFLWSWGWFATAGVLLSVFAGALWFMQKQIRDRADLTKVKTKKANKVALRRLKTAKIYMADMQEGEFFEEMLKALWGYMGDKLAIDVANLTKENVRNELEMRGVDEGQVEGFLSLVSECEFAQYSPAVGVQMDKAYGAALDLIERFESKI